MKDIQKSSAIKKLYKQLLENDKNLYRQGNITEAVKKEYKLLKKVSDNPTIQKLYKLVVNQEYGSSKKKEIENYYEPVFKDIENNNKDWKFIPITSSERTFGRQDYSILQLHFSNEFYRDNHIEIEPKYDYSEKKERKQISDIDFRVKLGIWAEGYGEYLISYKDLLQLNIPKDVLVQFLQSINKEISDKLKYFYSSENIAYRNELNKRWNDPLEIERYDVIEESVSNKRYEEIINPQNLTEEKILELEKTEDDESYIQDLWWELDNNIPERKRMIKEMQDGVQEIPEGCDYIRVNFPNSREYVVVEPSNKYNFMGQWIIRSNFVNIFDEKYTTNDLISIFGIKDELIKQIIKPLEKHRLSSQSSYHRDVIEEATGNENFFTALSKRIREDFQYHEYDRWEKDNVRERYKSLKAHTSWELLDDELYGYNPDKTARFILKVNPMDDYSGFNIKLVFECSTNDADVEHAYLERYDIDDDGNIIRLDTYVYISIKDLFKLKIPQDLLKQFLECCQKNTENDRKEWKSKSSFRNTLNKKYDLPLEIERNVIEESIMSNKNKLEEIFSYFETKLKDSHYHNEYKHAFEDLLKTSNWVLEENPLKFIFNSDSTDRIFVPTLRLTTTVKGEDLFSSPMYSIIIEPDVYSSDRYGSYLTIDTINYKLTFCKGNISQNYINDFIMSLADLRSLNIPENILKEFLQKSSSYIETHYKSIVKKYSNRNDVIEESIDISNIEPTLENCWDFSRAIIDNWPYKEDKIDINHLSFKNPESLKKLEEIFYKYFNQAIAEKTINYIKDKNIEKIMLCSYFEHMLLLEGIIGATGGIIQNYSNKGTSVIYLENDFQNEKLNAEIYFSQDPDLYTNDMMYGLKDKPTLFMNIHCDELETDVFQEEVSIKDLIEIYHISSTLINRLLSIKPKNNDREETIEESVEIENDIISKYLTRALDSRTTNSIGALREEAYRVIEEIRKSDDIFVGEININTGEPATAEDYNRSNDYAGLVVKINYKGKNRKAIFEFSPTYLCFSFTVYPEIRGFLGMGNITVTDLIDVYNIPEDFVKDLIKLSKESRRNQWLNKENNKNFDIIEESEEWEEVLGKEVDEEQELLDEVEKLLPSSSIRIAGDTNTIPKCRAIIQMINHPENWKLEESTSGHLTLFYYIKDCAPVNYFSLTYHDTGFIVKGQEYFSYLLKLRYGRYDYYNIIATLNSYALINVLHIPKEIVSQMNEENSKCFFNTAYASRIEQRKENIEESVESSTELQKHLYKAIAKRNFDDPAVLEILTNELIKAGYEKDIVKIVIESVEEFINLGSLTKKTQLIKEIFKKLALCDLVKNHTKEKYNKNLCRIELPNEQIEIKQSSYISKPLFMVSYKYSDLNKFSSVGVTYKELVEIFHISRDLIEQLSNEIIKKEKEINHHTLLLQRECGTEVIEESIESNRFKMIKDYLENNRVFRDDIYGIHTDTEEGKNKIAEKISDIFQKASTSTNRIMGVFDLDGKEIQSWTPSWEMVYMLKIEIPDNEKSFNIYYHPKRTVFISNLAVKSMACYEMSAGDLKRLINLSDEEIMALIHGNETSPAEKYFQDIRKSNKESRLEDDRFVIEESSLTLDDKTSDKLREVINALHNHGFDDLYTLKLDPEHREEIIAALRECFDDKIINFFLKNLVDEFNISYNIFTVIHYLVKFEDVKNHTVEKYDGRKKTIYLDNKKEIEIYRVFDNKDVFKPIFALFIGDGISVQVTTKEAVKLFNISPKSLEKLFLEIPSRYKKNDKKEEIIEESFDFNNINKLIREMAKALNLNLVAYNDEHIDTVNKIFSDEEFEILKGIALKYYKPEQVEWWINHEKDICEYFKGLGLRQMVCDIENIKSLAQFKKASVFEDKFGDDVYITLDNGACIYRSESSTKECLIRADKMTPMNIKDLVDVLHIPVKIVNKFVNLTKEFNIPYKNRRNIEDRKDIIEE